MAHMDPLGKAWEQLQVTLSQATGVVATSAHSVTVTSLDTLQGNNIASTTAETVSKIGSSIDFVCESLLGLQRR